VYTVGFMRKLVLLAAAAAAVATAQIDSGSGERMRAHVKFLASDLLEGRGVATRGEQLTTEYIAAQFALIGAKPAGDNGTYFQNVPLVGVTTAPGSNISAVVKGRTIPLEWLNEFVGANQRQTPEEAIDAELVYVGHGITAPEFSWDDFKGVDVKGKILLQFTNEPDSVDPKFFGGRALTYYGRWTYKFEEARRRGALGSLIIHTDDTAGYGWQVVRSSWGREQSFVRVQPGAHELALAGWITSAAAEKILAGSGYTVAGLLKLSNQRDFRPIPLGIRITGRMISKIRDENTRNVVAKIPGSDPRLASEAVVFSAHWDHLGLGEAVGGDNIYNGAVDNATGVAMLIELARAWASLPAKPRRTAIFVAVTAEEHGLWGSEYYAQHPSVPAGKIALALNFDSFSPYGRTRDAVLNGAERTTFWPAVQRIAKRFSLTLKPDPAPEQGSYYRSDHFSFAKAGIPAFSVQGGSDFVKGSPPSLESIYHQPSDEYRDDWDFSGMEQMASFGLALGIEAANADTLPTWQRGDEFLAAREASMKQK
jgi:Zn-dependent M28 family amino/carboxypeptidase